MAQSGTTSGCGSGTDVAPLRALFVDDDPVARRSIARFFRMHGVHTDLAANPKEAIGAVESNDYHVLLLDWRLRDAEIDGLELAKMVRPRWPQIGIVMISGYSDPADRAAALDRGVVDDYIVKPGHAEEIVARVRAAGRRSQTALSAAWGPFRVDTVRQRVWVNGAEVFELQTVHIRILAYLVQNAGRVCSHAELHEAIFKTIWQPDSRNSARAISALRACCGEAGKQIVTVRSDGYGLGIVEVGPSRPLGNSP